MGPVAAAGLSSLPVIVPAPSIPVTIAPSGAPGPVLRVPTTQSKAAAPVVTQDAMNVCAVSTMKAVLDVSVRASQELQNANQELQNKKASEELLKLQNQQLQMKIEELEGSRSEKQEQVWLWAPFFCRYPARTGLGHKSHNWCSSAMHMWYRI